jgi:hypothetical protein
METLPPRLNADPAPPPGERAGDVAGAGDWPPPAATAPPPQPFLTRAERGRRRWVGLVLLLLAAPGCTLGQCFTCADGSQPPKPMRPAQVVTTWSNQVYYVPDTQHNGVPMPGLAGRLYLFGETIGFPQVGDGGAFVALYDDSVDPPNGKLLEEWHIDKDTLRRLLKKDAIGWGYTLFLPWGSYRPDVTRVHLTCRYDPAQGTPLYADASSLTLDHGPPPGGAAAAATTPGAPVAPPPAPEALPVR